MGFTDGGGGWEVGDARSPFPAPESLPCKGKGAIQAQAGFLPGCLHARVTLRPSWFEAKQQQEPRPSPPRDGLPARLCLCEGDCGEGRYQQQRSSWCGGGERIPGWIREGD